MAALARARARRAGVPSRDADCHHAWPPRRRGPATRTSGVDCARSDVQDVAGGRSIDARARAERGTELRDIRAETDLGTLRGLTGPQLVDQAVDRNGPTWLDREEPDQRTEARAADLDRGPVARCLDRPEDSKLEALLYSLRHALPSPARPGSAQPSTREQGYAAGARWSIRFGVGDSSPRARRASRNGCEWKADASSARPCHRIPGATVQPDCNRSGRRSDGPTGRRPTEKGRIEIERMSTRDRGQLPRPASSSRRRPRCPLASSVACC